MNLVFHTATLVLIYGMLATSLSLLVGRVGLFSLAHAAFFGIGAYAVAIGSASYGTSLAAGLLIGATIAVLVSLALSRFILKKKADDVLIATFALSVVAFSVFNNWTDVTRGALGIPIPRPGPSALAISVSLKFLLLSLAGATVALSIVYRIASSPLGRVLMSIREGGHMALTCGKNINAAQAAALAVSSGLASSAGSVYAAYVSFVEPQMFTVNESILVMAMVLLGGANRLWGGIVGASILVGIPELLRLWGMPPATAGHLRQLLYGFILVAVVAVRPAGTAFRTRSS